jgi:hypothetical protein
MISRASGSSCKSKNVIIAEYALHDATKPIGVSEYRLTTSLPSNLLGNLPTIKELEAELKKTKTTSKEAGRCRLSNGLLDNFAISAISRRSEAHQEAALGS